MALIDLPNSSQWDTSKSYEEQTEEAIAFLESNINNTPTSRENYIDGRVRHFMIDIDSSPLAEIVIEFSYNYPIGNRLSELRSIKSKNIQIKV